MLNVLDLELKLFHSILQAFDSQLPSDGVGDMLFPPEVLLLSSLELSFDLFVLSFWVLGLDLKELCSECPVGVWPLCRDIWIH